MGGTDSQQQRKMATAASASRAAAGPTQPARDASNRYESCTSLLADARKVTIQLTKVNKHFICALCRGYFRDAHKIKDCAHTFCAGCIRPYFWNDKRNNSCPTCRTFLGVKPWKQLVSDPAIQGLADKLLPSFKEKEEAAIVEFYGRLGCKRKRGDGDDDGRTRQKQPPVPVSSMPPPPARTDLSQDQHKSPQPSTRKVSFELHPQRNRGVPLFLQVDKLRRPLMKTDPSFRIFGLRKFVAHSLGLDDANEIEILCKGTPVGGEYSLEFVEKTIWRSPAARMQLEYRRVVV